MTDNNDNPFHAQHIMEFCHYADAGDRAIAETVSKELMTMRAEIEELKATISKLQQQTPAQTATKKQVQQVEPEFVVSEKSIKALKNKILQAFSRW